MGYKMCTPRGTDFCGVQKVEMGYCTPKWGTVGNPDICTISINNSRKANSNQFQSIIILGIIGASLNRVSPSSINIIICE
jgi:hypothetical protein